MKRGLILAIFLIGFSGLVAQVILLRELLITFYGNELSIGIILANWLILEAVGCFFLGKRAEYVKRPLHCFVGLCIIFSLSFPLAIYLVRVLKELIGVAIGEGLGLVPMIYSSFLILLPASISHGALFTFSCKLYSLHSRPNATTIGNVYIYETIGTIAGGTFAYLFIPHLHSFQIALGVALLNFMVCFLLLFPFQQRQPLFTKILGSVSGILLLLVGFLIFSGVVNKFHIYSVKQQWKGQRVIFYQNSIYTNITVVERGGEYTFSSDGIPIITTPNPDITSVEEFAHLPMLSCSEPKDVLVISGGAGGVINEILKHPSVKRIDYVELDPLLLRIIRKFPTALTETELKDPRVNIHYTDGRLFVKNVACKYDLILVGFSNPLDLQTNRFFTKEFFSLAKERLKEEGILVLRLPGSLTYLSKELKDLNACIISTLKSIFPYLTIIPGDGLNLYLSSTSKNISLIGEAQLSQRLKERELDVHLLTPGHIQYKLHPRWLKWFLMSLESATQKINQDFQPLGLFFALSYWNALFSPSMQTVFNWFEKVNLRLIFALIFIVTLAFLAIRIKIKKLSTLSIPLCVTTTGFAGMIFDLILIFTFQVLYGYVFWWISLLVTSFMVGVAVGSLRMTSLLEQIKKDLALFLKLEGAIIIFSGVLPLIFIFFHLHSLHLVKFLPLHGLFLALSFISGFLVGAQFPLANKIHLHLSTKSQESKLSKTAGLLYGADLFGGWIGGIAGGVILLPILGLLGTCMVVLMLKVSSFIILATSKLM